MNHLLHNMSAPPRTKVESVMAPVHRRVVIISLYAFLQDSRLRQSTRLQKRLLKVGVEGLEEHELREALAPIVTDKLLAELDDEQPAPIPGVLLGWRPAPSLSEGAFLKDSELYHCRAPRLTLGVLARCEGDLYLGHRKPGGTLRELARRELAFDDARLAGLTQLKQLNRTTWPRAANDASSHWYARSPARNATLRLQAALAKAAKATRAAKQARPAKTTRIRKAADPTPDTHTKGTP